MKSSFSEKHPPVYSTVYPTVYIQPEVFDDAHRCRAVLRIGRGHPTWPGLVGVYHACGHSTDVRLGDVRIFEVYDL